MYQGNTVKSSQKGIQDPSRRDDDNIYNEINEYEYGVHDSSCHDYSEIKDNVVKADTSRVTDNDQTYDNIYNEINEYEVYDPSGHKYSELQYKVMKDDTAKRVTDNGLTNDNMYINEVNEDDVCEASAYEYCKIKDEDCNDHSNLGADDSPCLKMYDKRNNADVKNKSKRQSPDICYEEDDDSVTFYAAAAEVELPSTRNVGGNALLYETGNKTTAAVNCRVESFLSAVMSTDKEQAANQIAGCKVAPNASIEEEQTEQSETLKDASDDDNGELKSKVAI
ncbi:regulation of response to stimulus [Branchiostoma belcheri]|nr:regulation of response to stimulus [Branchiostoma belcheri]